VGVLCERVLAKGEIFENGRCGSKTGHCAFKETFMALKWSDVTTERTYSTLERADVALKRPGCPKSGQCGSKKGSVL